MGAFSCISCHLNYHSVQLLEMKASKLKHLELSFFLKAVPISFIDYKYKESRFRMNQNVGGVTSKFKNTAVYLVLNNLLYLNNLFQQIFLYNNYTYNLVNHSPIMSYIIFFSSNFSFISDKIKIIYILLSINTCNEFDS